MKSKVFKCFIGAVLVLCLTGCGKSHKTDSDLVGVWMDIDEENGFVLYEDGTFSEGDDKGTYYCEDDKLVIEIDDFKKIFQYKLADNYMTLIDEEGEEIIVKKQ